MDDKEIVAIMAAIIFTGIPQDIRSLSASISIAIDIWNQIEIKYGEVRFKEPE